jgi:hypothetical protein
MEKLLVSFFRWAHETSFDAAMIEEVIRWAAIAADEEEVLCRERGCRQTPRDDRLKWVGANHLDQ